MEAWALWLVDLLLVVAFLYSSRSVWVLYWGGVLFVLLLLYPGSAVMREFAYIATEAQLLPLCVNAAFAATQVIVTALWPNTSALERYRPTSNEYAVVVGILTCGAAMVFLSMPSLGDLVSLKWDRLAAERSGWRIVALNLGQFALAIASGCVVWLKGETRDRVMAVTIVGVTLLCATLLRVKAFALLIVLPLVVRAADDPGGMLRPKGLARGLFLGASMAALYVGITFVRYSGAIEDIAAKARSDAVLDAVKSRGIESQLARSYLEVVLTWRDRPVMIGGGYRRFLVAPFAMPLGEEAPENPIYAYYEVTNPRIASASRGSDHPTFFGDAFASFGILAPLAGAIVALLIGVSERLLGSCGPIGYGGLTGALSFSIPLIVRGSTYYALYNWAFVAISTLFIVWAVSHTRETVGPKIEMG